MTVLDSPPHSDGWSVTVTVAVAVAVAIATGIGGHGTVVGSCGELDFEKLLFPFLYSSSRELE
jgi:hypothetical protein